MCSVLCAYVYVCVCVCVCGGGGVRVRVKSCRVSCTGDSHLLQ